MKELILREWALGGLINKIAAYRHLDLSTEEFIYGTCSGLCFSQGDSFGIIAIVNRVPHNGDFKLCLESLESHARKLGFKRFQVREIWNTRLYYHLINLGFTPLRLEGEIAVEKYL